MPAPRWLARFNRHVTNRLTKLFVTRTRAFGVVVHRGRRSGRTFRTPVNVFPQRDGYVIALTYGPEADWVRNVLAAGQCELETRGRVMRLYSPRLVHDEQRRLMPPLVRAMLGIAHVHDFMVLNFAPEGGVSAVSQGQDQVR
jgi:deazaflavin-dependent oxidoreductase (nitroreductase family)